MRSIRSPSTAHSLAIGQIQESLVYDYINHELSSLVAIVSSIPEILQLRNDVTRLCSMCKAYFSKHRGAYNVRQSCRLSTINTAHHELTACEQLQPAKEGVSLMISIDSSLIENSADYAPHGTVQ